MDNTTTAQSAPHKTIAGKVLLFIGKEAGIIGQMFSKEEPQVQDALKAVSAYVQVIKTTLDKNPIVVEYLLTQANVGATPDEINDLLTKAAVSLGVIASDLKPTIIETIAAFQAHAGQLPDELAHNNFWTGFFNVLGAVVSTATPWGKIVSYGVLIYNQFVKGGAK